MSPIRRGWAVSAAALLALAGCTTDEPAPGPSSPPPTSVAPSVSPPGAFGEVLDPIPCDGDADDAAPTGLGLDATQLDHRGVTACLHGITRGTSPDTDSVAPGRPTLEIVATFLNDGPAQATLLSDRLDLVVLDGALVEPVLHGGRPEMPERLAAGDVFTGTWIFAVPEGATDDDLADLQVSSGAFTWWSIPDRGDADADG